MKEVIRPWQDFCRGLLRSRNDATVVISYPKSGRTWHRAAIGMYLAEAHGLDPHECLDIRQVARAAGLPAVSYTHNGANFLFNIGPGHWLNGNSLSWRGKNILLLVRDPRAILVSGYHHMT